MNIRQKYELNILYKEKELDLRKLADLFSVNVRTIRNDISQIEDYLCEKNINALIEVKSNIASIAIDDLEKLNNLVELNYQDFYSDKISNEERVLLILSDLCWSNKSLNIQDLADKYFVSRGTINSDLVSVKDYCEKNGINFYSARGKGIGIDEDENSRRKHLIGIIKEFVKLNQNANLDMTIYGQWFDLNEINKIQKIINEVDRLYDISLTDVAYEALVVHIALSIERYKNGNIEEDLTEQEFKEIDSLQFKIAKRIIDYRNNIGGFKELEEIKNVSGIGDKTFEKILPYICL